MITIRINELEPGMVLAKDVVGRFGRNILGAGNTITLKHIKIFKSWGVTELNIESIDSPSAEESSHGPESRAEAHSIEDKIREKFQFNDPCHPVIKELVKISMARDPRL